MSANACPRCQKTLPDITLRAIGQGTSCPFCKAPLKRAPRQTGALAVQTPPPAPPATPATAPKSFRPTIVGGTAVAPAVPVAAAVGASVVPARGQPAVRPLVTETDTSPTKVEAPARASAMPRPLVTDSDSGPTHAVVAAGAGGAAAAQLAALPDPDPLFESVEISPAPPTPPLGLPLLPKTTPAPRRGLAIVGLGIGLGVVAIAAVGFKLLHGSKPAAAPVTAQAGTPPQPAAPPVVAQAIPAEPIPDERTPAASPPEPAAPTAADSDEAPARSNTKRGHGKHGAAAHRTVATQRAKPHQRRGPRMKTVVLHQTKRAAGPTERADPRPPYERGNALLFAGDGKGAIAAYREAVRSAPSDPIGFRGLGLAYEQQGESAQAVRALRHYLKLAPHAPDRELITRRIDRLSKPKG